jgi:hypothetical protein
MKKITLLVLTFVFTIVSYSQTVLNYNTDDAVTTANSVGCPGGDNAWVRNFVVADFTLPASYELTSGTFGVQSVETTVDEDIIVNIYTTTDIDFPTSLAGASLAGSQTVTVPMTTTVPSIINFTFDTPVAIPDGTMAIIVEVQSDLGESFFIGGTAGETTDGWLKSTECGVTEYTTPAAISFPDAHFYITVTAEVATANINDNLASITNIFPNPISNELNISLPTSIEINSAILFDVLGKNTGIKLENGVMDTTNLSAGIYFLNIKTDSGELTQKVIKK